MAVLSGRLLGSCANARSASQGSGDARRDTCRAMSDESTTPTPAEAKHRGDRSRTG
jgi:hypothetical protein